MPPLIIRLAVLEQPELTLAARGIRQRLAGNLCVRRTEIGMVEGVEELSPQLERKPLMDSERLGDIHVQVSDRVRPTRRDIAWSAACDLVSGTSKCRRSEIWAFSVQHVFGAQTSARISYQIRTL